MSSGVETMVGVDAAGIRRHRAAIIVVMALLPLATSCGSNPNYALERCPTLSQAKDSAPIGRLQSDLRLMTLNMWGIQYVSADLDARFDALAERLNADNGIDVVGLEE